MDAVCNCMFVCLSKSEMIQPSATKFGKHERHHGLGLVFGQVTWVEVSACLYSIITLSWHSQDGGTVCCWLCEHEEQWRYGHG